MENLKPSLTPRTDLQPKSSDLDRSRVAAQRTAILFGCYRKADANDPEIYTMAVAATLAEYEPEVVEYVTDPRTGLPAKLKWLPSVAEVREACESRKEYLRARASLLSKGYTFAPDGRLLNLGKRHERTTG